MRNIIAILIIVSFCSCTRDPDEPEFKYEFQISRSLFINGSLQDSLMYFYNSDNRLLRVDVSHSKHTSTTYYVTYGSDFVSNWDGNYYFDTNGKLVKNTNPPSMKEFTYNNDYLTYQKNSFNEFMTQESYFYYTNNNVIKDSTIIYNQNYPSIAISVYNSTFTDTLNPQFIVDYSGLLEVPMKSINLIRESVAKDFGMLYKYRYDLSENELVQFSEFYDSYRNKLEYIITTRYRLYKK